MKQAIEIARGKIVQTHVSGHVRADDSLNLIRQFNPNTIIPVHTFLPEKLAEHIPNVRLMKDREIFQL
jgi:ribonuclease J